jgi:hypothetical protein
MAYNPFYSQTAQSILKELNGWLLEHSLFYTDHERWYIGITDDADRRYNEHVRNSKIKNFSVKHFKFWHAKTFKIARAIESHGHSIGMLDTDLLGNATENSVLICIFQSMSSTYSSQTAPLVDK